VRRPLDRADGRPRIHIWPTASGWFHWSIGPTGQRFAETETPGRAVDAAILHLGEKTAAGTVVIVEPQL